MEGTVTMGKRTPIEGAVEWCFRINDEEAVVFGRAEKNDPLKIEIPAEEEANIVFRSEGSVFEIFPRQLVEKETEVFEEAQPVDATDEDAAQ
jgi:hypothetical protein